MDSVGYLDTVLAVVFVASGVHGREMDLAALASLVHVVEQELEELWNQFRALGEARRNKDQVHGTACVLVSLTRMSFNGRMRPFQGCHAGSNPVFRSWNI